LEDEAGVGREGKGLEEETGFGREGRVWKRRQGEEEEVWCGRKAGV
jgi:hypothetical protein